MEVLEILRGMRVRAAVLRVYPLDRGVRALIWGPKPLTPEWRALRGALYRKGWDLGSGRELGEATVCDILRIPKAAPTPTRGRLASKAVAR